MNQYRSLFVSTLSIGVFICTLFLLPSNSMANEIELIESKVLELVDMGDQKKNIYQKEFDWFYQHHLDQSRFLAGLRKLPTKTVPKQLIQALETNQQALEDYFQVKQAKLEEIPYQANQYQDFIKNQVKQIQKLKKFRYYRGKSNKAEKIPSVLGPEALNWLNSIFNFGQKVWAVVESGKPAVNIERSYANALPAVTDSEGKPIRPLELEMWNHPKARVLRATYTNLLGIDVVKVVFYFWSTTGGRYATFDEKENKKSVGYYIANATIIPQSLDVKWGFSFDTTIKMLDPTNVASKEDPVAALQTLLNFVIKNPFREIQKTYSFYVRGNQ
jgi:hypothetical protein